MFPKYKNVNIEHSFFRRSNLIVPKIRRFSTYLLSKKAPSLVGADEAEDFLDLYSYNLLDC